MKIGSFFSLSRLPCFLIVISEILNLYRDTKSRLRSWINWNSYSCVCTYMYLITEKPKHVALLGVMQTVLAAWFIYRTSILRGKLDLGLRLSLRVHYLTYNPHQTVTKQVPYHSFCCFWYKFCISEIFMHAGLLSLVAEVLNSAFLLLKGVTGLINRLNRLFT